VPHTELDELESTIKQIPGVLGCAILRGSEGPTEIQAFTHTGTDRDEIQARIMEEIAGRDLGPQLSQVHVFELEAESYFGDLESLERAVEFAEQEARAKGPIAERPKQPEVPEGAELRPRITRVSLSSSSWTSQATVALGDPAAEVVGEAHSEKTPHGLKVLAEATLSAVSQLVPTNFELKSASLVNVGGKEAVLVLVSDEYVDMLGSALVRSQPVTEATVRATLDAINRRLGRAGQ
jgi:hypothetical protein